MKQQLQSQPVITLLNFICVAQIYISRNVLNETQFVRMLGECYNVF